MILWHINHWTLANTGSPFSKSGFFILPFIMHAGGNKLPSKLQQTIAVIISPFSAEVDIAPVLEPFSTKTWPGRLLFAIRIHLYWAYILVYLEGHYHIEFSQAFENS